MNQKLQFTPHKVNNTIINNYIFYTQANGMGVVLKSSTKQKTFSGIGA